MRIRPFPIVILLLVFAMSSTWGGGEASGSKTDSLLTPRESLARNAAERTPGDQPHHRPPLRRMAPDILLVLAGVGIAIAAAGLWIARRARREGRRKTTNRAEVDSPGKRDPRTCGSPAMPTPAAPSEKKEGMGVARTT